MSATCKLDLPRDAAQEVAGQGRNLVKMRG